MTSKGKFVVTGCTGLIGHGICSFLLANGHQVIGISRQKLVSRHPAFTAHTLDIREPSAAGALAKLLDPDSVFVHSAAFVPRAKSAASWDEYWRSNVAATRMLLESSSALSPRPHFIFLSGNSFCRDANCITESSPYVPENDYHTSKIMGEILCEQFRNQHNLPVSILRVRGPYGYVGGDHAVIAKFIERARHSENLELQGTGERKQTFTFVEDIGLACERILHTRCSGTFNIAGTHAVTMKELAHLVLKAFPETRSRITYSGIEQGDLCTGIPVSIRVAKEKLGFEPVTSLEAGLATIAAWRREGRLHHYFDVSSST